jgi:spore coat protein U-like protein
MPTVRQTMGLALASSAAAAVVVAAAAVPEAGAGQDTDQLTVTATVQSGCTLNGGSISFGQYTSGQAGDLDAVGQINYANCNGTLRFELDAGTGGGNTANRQMSKGGDRLRYQLYQNQARSIVFGSGNEARTEITVGTQTSRIEVFGRIFGGQLASPGSYADTVNITLTF